MESDTNYCSARSIYKRISKQAKLNKKTKKYNLIEKFNTDKQIVDTVFEDFNYENDNIKSKALNLNYTLDEEYKPYLSYKSLLLYKDSRNLALKAFEWLIFPIKFDVFINEFWEKKPLLVKRNKFDYYNELFSLCEFDIILRKEFLSFTENIDLTTYNDGIKEIHNPIGRAYSPIVWDYYNEGCSVRLLNPQKFSDNIWRLNSVLQEFFSSMVGCNVYLTPPNSQGFAPHYDDIDAFVMQIEGKKLWKVYHPYPHHKPQDKIERVKHLLPLYPSNNFSEKSDFDVHFWANPLIKTVLEPGDLLYMPRGFIHQASTLIEQDIGHINDIESREIFSCGKSKKSREINGNPNKKFKKEAKNDSQHSLHLTLSTCQNNTWGQLIKNAFDLSLKSLMQNNVKFRRSLPPRYLQYTGLPYRNVDLNFDSNKSNDPKCNVGLRTKFVSNFHSLCQDVLQNISPDLAVDIFSISSNAGCYLRDSLPPCLNIYEKMGSIFDDLDNSESCERILSKKSLLPTLDSHTRVKLLRYGCFRVMSPDCKIDEEGGEKNQVSDAVTVYHNLENGRNYREKNMQYFMITLDLLPVIEHLIQNYPNFVKISSFPLIDTHEKIDVALSLYEKGILMVSPKSLKRIQKMD